MADAVQNPSWESSFLEIVSGRRRGPAAGLARACLSLLAVLYVGGLKLYLLPYRLGLRRQARLPVPVVSVGNIASGGTGKTGMTISLAAALQARGHRVCVLSRGYRGRHEHGAAVVSDGIFEPLSASEAGDEPHMIAAALPEVPVLVGKDRRRVGQLACDRFGPDLLLLDDGMQFYQLHRDLEIAMLRADRPFDNGFTMPRGLLREPPGHLARAHWIVLLHARLLDDEGARALEMRLRSLAPNATVTQAEYRATGLTRLPDGGAEILPPLEGRPVATVCALGNPDAFEAQVRAAGMQVVRTVRLSDHAAPSPEAWAQYAADAAAAGAEALVVTEKDAVKFRASATVLPFYALRVRLAIRDEEQLLHAIEAHLK